MSALRNSEFGLTAEQKLIRQTILPMLSEVLPREKIKELDEAYEFPHEAYQALAAGGWMGLPHETEYGGSDGSHKDLAVFVETVAYHNVQLASAWLTTVIYGGMQVRHGGSVAVKQQILPGLISGELRLALCITEPETGSDVAAIRTQARKDGDNYILSGQKVFITCAHVAHFLVVAAKTDSNAGHKGITLFLVDSTTPGVSIRPLRGLGRRMIHTNEVFLDNVRVPATNILGDENGGWKRLMHGLNLERLCLSASACGNMARIIDYAADYARDRTQFGNAITSYQAISHKFAELQIMAESARAMVYRVADMLDAGENPTTETAIAKVLATENNVKCADMGIQIMGGAGYMNDHEMQMYFRDSRVGPIGGGTSEVMRTVIAKQMNL
ncbi:acyl-CoA dehydrogenase family protein [Cupriavidus metallidurans]|uniref:acyl-CoA dehydrogenase family protein n=1 Tax=Cupriavidus metallidurans TaxID=119219 RepID=UPI00055B4B38|nr:acyl-CoA dehydrogenase family protein [Cupriavidus metallidurans]